MRHLLVYFGKYGTTANSARIIQETIGKSCDTATPDGEKVKVIRGYDSLIIGTAIYRGRVPSAITAFIQENRTILNSRRLSFFIHCLEPKLAFERMRSAMGDQLFEHGQFKAVLGGRVHLDQHNFITRQILKRKGKNTGLNFKNYDSTSLEGTIDFARQILDNFK